MRILITGGTGFLGSALVKHLTPSHEVVATGFRRAADTGRSNLFPADLRNAEATKALVRTVSPNVIIHAAAITKTDECQREPRTAYAVNVQGTANLLAATQDFSQQPYFVYISTDLVFDGERGWYGEEDVPNPIMTYGQTKLEAEKLVVSYRGEWAIVRTALMYGAPGSDPPSFLDWMLDNIRSGTGALFADEFRTPVFVDDVCGLLQSVLEFRATGIYHCAGPRRLSRYEMGLIAADALGLPRENVRQALLNDTSTPAPRPKDVSLKIDKAARDLSFSPRSFAEAIAAFR